MDRAGATTQAAGAQFGLNMLWTMPLAYPLMAAIGGRVKVSGSTDAIGLRRVPNWLLRRGVAPVRPFGSRPAG